MKTLETVYWLRFALGIVAALVCIAYGVGTNSISSQVFSVNVLLNSVSLTVIIYLMSYYLLKARFRLFVKNAQKILTTGIGVYFLTWITFYALFYTIIAGA